MNELQIIQQQLATEREHFAQVAEALSAALGTRATSDRALVRACADYFEFALTRLQSDHTREAYARLEAARAEDRSVPLAEWRSFLQVFTAECAQHFAAIDALGERNESVGRWRAVAGLDADAIVGERERFSRVSAALCEPA